MEQSSSSSSPHDYYDVFISFRGDDTRYGFTDHLYHALFEKGITAFRDSEKLQTASESVEAIRKSTSAVIVLSKNYASSSRCLDELAQICERKILTMMQVLPVFYRVEPAVIRKKTDRFKFMDDVSWQVTSKRSESGIIQEIANHISNLLSISNEEYVGMDARIEKVESRLNLKSNDVRTIGIWGMGGSGKTALAKEVFKKIRQGFHLSVFVSQVRLKSAVELQKSLCESFLGKESCIHIDTVEKGIKLLKMALLKKKVLIILDDVDSFKQIECLAPGGPLGEKIWGEGSRLIITTRDKSSLRCLNVKENNIYEVEKLSDEEASQLFYRKAFHNLKKPPEKFVKSFLQYADGLPLAHKALGPYLSTGKVDEWTHVLHRLLRLDTGPGKDIFAVLQTSFDRLQDTDKKIFLDIACFFNGEDYVRVKNILKACGFSSGIGMNNLIDKSLVKVENNKLRMHELLQDLACHIVRKESVFPGERSRLWVKNSAHKLKDSSCFEDVCKVLMENSGTAAVEGLFLSLPEKAEMSLKADPFLNMRKLRLLKIYNVNFLDVQFGYLSSNLRILEWHECPLHFLPHNFKLVNLVEIKMPNSRIERLWNDKLSLGKLTLMDLSHCRSLVTSPDFSAVPNLERLILQGCNELSELHCTIGNLQKLKFLNLKGCTSLQSLPQHISMRSLQTFILSGCSKLQEFPDIGENMHTLSELYLDGTAILELSVSIQHLEGLILLNLSGCRNLLGLPSILCSCLISLKFLYLSLCSSLDKLPDDIGFLEHLEELDACNTAIKEVPDSISLLKNLKLLCFRGCSGLESLKLPNKFSGLNSLTTLNLGRCNLVEGAIPDDIGDLKSLQSLDLSENNFSTIPESISQLSELTEISLFKCGNLRSLPNDIPSSLRNVNVFGCPMLKDFSSGWGRYPPLKGLSIPNCRKLESDESCLALHELPLLSSSLFQMEVSESPSSSPSSFNLPFHWEHDVLLNFGGEEPHPAFSDHLYEALSWRGIDVFRDLEKLQMGNSIAQEHWKAVEESQYAIIIFSPLYPTSTWCLDELVRIHGCKKVTGLRVFAVFYHVEPSEVRRQTGKYENVFSKHEKKFSDSKVKEWRQALKEIGSYSGWHVKDRNESQIIENITERISDILSKRSSLSGRSLIGMDARVQTLVSYLNLGSEEVLTIGVWGVRGNGKTTLAKEVYREIRGQFHTSGFVCNFRLQSESELQKLVCESLMGNGDVGAVEKGSKWTRLSKKKLLLVLDDVDGLKEIKQLVPGGLAGIENLWGHGSRLIVTSRFIRTLTELGIPENKIYKVGKPSDEEVSQLMCQTAFKNVNLPEESIKSKSYLKHASALPSAHDVLRSHLSGKNADERLEVLSRLDEDPNNDNFSANRLDDHWWNSWCTSLKQRYLNSPWVILSFLAAVIVLFLVFIQGFYSVYRYYCDHQWNASHASMNHKYFNNLCAIISFLLLVVALFLTFIRTCYSVYSYCFDHRWHFRCVILMQDFYVHSIILFYLSAVVVMCSRYVQDLNSLISYNHDHQGDASHASTDSKFFNDLWTISLSLGVVVLFLTFAGTFISVYYGSRCNSWRASLENKNLNNLWAILKLLVVFVAMCLTSTVTSYLVHQLNASQAMYEPQVLD